LFVEVVVARAGGLREHEQHNRQQQRHFQHVVDILAYSSSNIQLRISSDGSGLLYSFRVGLFGFFFESCWRLSGDPTVAIRSSLWWWITLYTIYLSPFPSSCPWNQALNLTRKLAVSFFVHIICIRPPSWFSIFFSSGCPT
jgi:hypothetical protein